MRIAIDARVVTDKTHGISRYVHDLIIALSEEDHENEYILLSNAESLRNFSEKKKILDF